jgi:hypothetical protein
MGKIPTLDGAGNMQSFNFTPEDMFWGQLAGCLEAIDAGTTYVLDHSHGNYTPEYGKSLLPCFFFAPASSLLSHSSCLFIPVPSVLPSHPVPTFLPHSSCPIALAQSFRPVVPASLLLLRRSCSLDLTRLLLPRSCPHALASWPCPPLLPPHPSPLVLASLALTSSPSFLPSHPCAFALSLFPLPLPNKH